MGDLRSVSAEVQVATGEARLSIGSGWTLSRDFEDAPLGQNAHEDAPFPFGFSSGARDTYFDNVNVAAGLGNVRMDFFEDDVSAVSRMGGWLEWREMIPNNMEEGKIRKNESIWLRARWYFPADFNPRCKDDCSEGLKFMRMMVAGSGIDDQKNEGSIEVKLRKVNDPTKMAIRVISEVAGSGYPDSDNYGPTFNENNYDSGKYPKDLYIVDKGSHFSIEIQITMDHVQNRGAVTRVWANETLIIEDKISHTGRFDYSYVDHLKLFTYWNGRVPQDQSCWCDGIEVSKRIPSKRDSHGNPRIGS